LVKKEDAISERGLARVTRVKNATYGVIRNLEATIRTKALAEQRKQLIIKVWKALSKVPRAKGSGEDRHVKAPDVLAALTAHKDQFEFKLPGVETVKKIMAALRKENPSCKHIGMRPPLRTHLENTGCSQDELNNSLSAEWWSLNS
jgi:hypothetical protein